MIKARSSKKQMFGSGSPVHPFLQMAA